MFWKKKQTEAKAAEPAPLKVEKEKKLKPKDIMVGEIEQLSPGESVSYRLGEVYGGELAVIELNPEYPGKGKRYFLSLEKIVDGKPTGKRGRLWNTDNPKDIASWILERGGKLYSQAG